MTTATKPLPTFEVDKEGLRKILARKGMAWIIPELIQNCWDENTTRVTASLRWEKGPTRKGKSGTVQISVEDDDPDGFTNIAHAFTLFAESEKKGHSEKRGRFNVGEKLVIAACDSAIISTTTGTVKFGPDGRRMLRSTRKHGTEFYAVTKMTQDEYDESLATVRMMIPPPGITTTINDEEIQHRNPVRSFSESLRTPLGDNLRLSTRITTISLYEPVGDEVPHLFEMGIPVVPIGKDGDRWHLHIGQKVPLNIDRDNVTPAYLRDVRTAVANHAHDLLGADDASEAWALDAMADEKIGPAALGELLDLRFGEKRVAFSPRDQEANKIAASEGYTVVSGRSLPADVWTNARAHGLIPSSSEVTPSPKPYTPGQENTRKTEPREKWTQGMLRLENLVQELGPVLCDASVIVEFVNDADCMNFAATYARNGTSGRMEFNIRTLGRKWFEEDIAEKHVSLIIHELGHHRSSDHLSREYYAALTDLGARLAFEIAVDPDWWQRILEGNV